MRHTIDLCGSWELVYSENVPTPDSDIPDFFDSIKTEAVPGFWEDMIPTLQMAPYWDSVKSNPEFRTLSYPMTGTVPDMILDTVVGCFWYRRYITVDSSEAGKSVIFHCQGVQNRGLLWVNGHFAGEHCGYSTDFSFDVTEFIKIGEENEFVFAVSNHDALNENGELISGCTNRAANRYTGGIIGAISLVIKSKNSISDAYAAPYSPDTDSFNVCASIICDSPYTLNCEIYDGNSVVYTATGSTPEICIPRGSLEFWSTKNPKLYTLRLTLITNDTAVDTLSRSFGIRQLAVNGQKLTFNGKPIYLRGICEHGYFAKTVHPTGDINYYINLIRRLKQLDFNFIRFHTWIPTEEYMCAADKMGILLHVESPNNTTETEWADIMRFVRRHPSVVICCCGNEMLVDDEMIDHLERCAKITRELAPGLLFSPMNALRGVEYFWQPSNLGDDVVETPLRHNPKRLARLQGFSDLFSSYSLGHLSYNSEKGDPAKIDSFADTYKLPRISHEICIHGTYVDLGLEWRYDGTRIGETALYSSVRKILAESGLIDRAPLYYVNSCQWQRLLRKHCFENARLAGTLSGYDFLGDIDHHWHTFGYHVGMMNEFYEMKPTETVENVRRYNGESVLLCDLPTDRCFFEGDDINIKFLASLFGGESLENAELNVRLETLDKRILSRFSFTVNAENGGLSELAQLVTEAPTVDKPKLIRVCARISQGGYELENEWDIHVFPKITEKTYENIICTETLDDGILEKLNAGADVLLIGAGPLQENPLSFRLSLAGRTAGNLATVIENHPLTETFEHEGFCGWQFYDMMMGGSCIYYSNKTEVPFDPIIEVVSSYKWIRKQAALAELKVGAGRLVISTFNLTGNAASKWWRENLLTYMSGNSFTPRTSVTLEQFKTLYSDGTSAAGSVNSNVARNTNDKTMKK